MNSEGSLTLRRSSRLSNRTGIKPSEGTIQVKAKRRKLSAPKPLVTVRICPNIEKICVTHTLPATSGSSERRSLQFTRTELLRREHSLHCKEQEYLHKCGELEERLTSLSKKEEEASTMLSQIAEREVKAALNQLEEHFTCALCYEIMANPYTLNPGLCGHTFCALCILKWFFSRLHNACGSWHESVDCPICRSVLALTPDGTPRSTFTFPFVPNRTAAAVLESLIEKLAGSRGQSMKVKRERSEGLGESESRKREREKDCVPKLDGTDENTSVADWREGGHMRTEWLKKDRDGKREMGHLFKIWKTVGSQEFLNTKKRLGV